MILVIALLTALVVINAILLILLAIYVSKDKSERHTYSTIACLEDAIAVILDSEFELGALQARLGTARKILGIGRKDPHSYPVDKPAERRPKGWKE